MRRRSGVVWSEPPTVRAWRSETKRVPWVPARPSSRSVPSPSRRVVASTGRWYPTARVRLPGWLAVSRTAATWSVVETNASRRCSTPPCSNCTVCTAESRSSSRRYSVTSRSTSPGNSRCSSPSTWNGWSVRGAPSSVVSASRCASSGRPWSSSRRTSSTCCRDSGLVGSSMELRAPDAFVIDVDGFAGRLTHRHEADHAVAQGQRVVPARGGAVIPECEIGVGVGGGKFERHEAKCTEWSRWGRVWGAVVSI